jgi:hypothetical protein
MEQTIPITIDACGTTFTGWLHEQQQYTLTPKGQLNFHYIANGQLDGTTKRRQRPDHAQQQGTGPRHRDHAAGPWPVRR